MSGLNLQPIAPDWHDPLGGLLAFAEGPVTRVPSKILGHPPQLGGRLLFNGPQFTKVTQSFYKHWLDGDGCISEFDLTNFAYRSVFVETEKLKSEAQADKPLYRSFGTQIPGTGLNERAVVASPVNVSIHHFGGKLLAFGEQSPIYELDPVSLATIGEWRPSPQSHTLMGQSGHPKYDATSNLLVNFGIDFLELSPILHLYCHNLSTEEFNSYSIELPYPCSVHDFVLTNTLAIFHVSPLLLSRRAIVEQQATVMGALTWQPEHGSYVIAIDLASGEKMSHTPVGQGHVIHLVNGFGDCDGFTVDVIEYDRPYYHDLGPIPYVYPRPLTGGLVRYDVVDNHATATRLPNTYAADFPAIHPDDQGQPYGHCIVLGMDQASSGAPKFFNQIYRVDWQSSERTDVWQLPQGEHFSAEPIYTTDPADPLAEWVIVPSFNRQSNSSSLHFFAPDRVNAGPIGTVQYSEPIPIALHGCHYSE